MSPHTNGGIRKSARDKRAPDNFVAGSATLASPHAFETPRFHVVPANGWHRFLWKMKCHALNTIRWSGAKNERLPVPPQPCFLLPASDEIALVIADERAALEKLGWKLLTCDVDVIDRLQSKVRLRDYGEKLGMLNCLPRHYDSLSRAQFPCMLKGARGNHGKTVWIVNSREEALEVTGAKDVAGDPDWLLQEIIPGGTEYSVSLLVRDSQILDAVETRYEYDRDVYVWPHVEELGRDSSGRVKPEHIAVMSHFLGGYSGICNFNYKLRPNGEMAIFEVNTRIGADLACDVPRDRARDFFEKLEQL
jgi:hypothetical protein